MPAETPAAMLQRHERLLRAAKARPAGSGAPGTPGAAATVAVGSTTTGAPGTSAAVVNAGDTSAAVLNFTIPRGDPGTAGAAATIDGATATPLAAGATPTVTLGGTSTARTFAFGIPASSIDSASEQTFARLRLTSTNDLYEASTLHALQIGPSTGQHLAADNNEIGSRNADGTWSAMYLYDPRAGGAQSTAVDSLIRRDFVETIRSEAAAPWSTGWANWNDGVYRDLRFFVDRDGWVTVSGLARYNGGTGAGLQICSLTGNYVPRDGLRDVLNANLNDTAARWVNVQATGLFLRGALPTAGNFLAINGRYPGVLVTT